MDDLISRQRAIQLLKDRLDEDYLDGYEYLEQLKGMPSAQPEIIRCKDCKHYYFADNRVPSEQSWVCDAWGVDQTAHMGYCFKAERKEVGGSNWHRIFV